MKYPEDFINKIIQDDCIEVMKEMPDNSIDMCLTSPPYWGLRDYGVEQIFGGDKDCKHEWKNKIKGKKLRGTDTGYRKEIYPEIHLPDSNICSKCGAWKGQLGLEPTPEMYIEHMTMIFHEVKRVLKKEGTLWLNIGDTYSASSTHASNSGATYYDGISKSYGKDSGRDVRSEHKRFQDGLPQKCLCMIPERLAWSLIQDGWILRNKIIWHKPNPMPSSVKDRFSNTWEYVYMFSQSKKYYFDLDAVREKHAESSIFRAMYPVGAFSPDTKDSHVKLSTKKNTDTVMVKINPLGKNPGDVFEISTQPFPEAHSAVFPEKLCEKPIKAGSPKNGIVLDPFCGAGTACLVAKQLGRYYIGIDISGKYCEMARKRIGEWLF